MGYDNQHRGYRLYQPSSHAIFVSRDVKFNELLEESASYVNLDEDDDSSVAPNWLDVNVDLSPKDQNSLT